MATEATAPTPTKFQVPAPFTEGSPGDCILRTKDGSQFSVYRVVLSLASSVFSDMFGLPGDQENTPVIDVEEDAMTIYTLLVMLYPMEPPVISDYDLACKLVAACDKYFINVFRLRAFLYDVLSSPAASEKDPMGVYALCWRLGRENEAKKASRFTHSIDISNPQMKLDLIQRSGSLNSLLALWDMRLRRETALENLLKVIGVYRIGCSSHLGNYDLQVWTSKWMEMKPQLRTFLARPIPSFAKNEWLFGRSIEAYNDRCTSCQQEVSRRGNQAIEALAKYPQTISGISSE